MLLLFCSAQVVTCTATGARQFHFAFPILQCWFLYYQTTCFKINNNSKFTLLVWETNRVHFIPSLLLQVKYINMVTRLELVLLQHLQQLLDGGITGQQLALLLHGCVSLTKIIILCLCAGMNLGGEEVSVGVRYYCFQRGPQKHLCI